MVEPMSLIPDVMPTTSEKAWGIGGRSLAQSDIAAIEVERQLRPRRPFYQEMR
jgi:hypothetical protein